ncbi:MAG: Ig-like domain-containing protein [Chloroflexi bacterium]|nr:Ig-like domain-containing protein [Chloroflexota bacterium]
MKVLSRGLLVVFLAFLFVWPASAAVQSVGPVDPANGFPQYYSDSNNLALQLCLDNNGFCVLPPTEKFGGVVTYDPSKPVAFPSNYPSEAFYFIADSDVIRVGPNRAGKAILRVALEGAFGTLNPVGAPAPGQQMTFLRVNLKKINGLKPNSTYTITYPYGTFTVRTDVFGNTVRGLAGQAYRTEDGCAATPCDFTMLLPAPTTHIGPFLTWTGLPPGGLVDPVTGNHYVSDGVTPHTVTGSPLIDARTGQPQNFFRIDGPDIGGRGINTIQTNLWTLSGKIAPAPGPVAPELTSITVEPAAPALLAGASQQFTAVTRDQFGNPIPAVVVWSSSDPAVGTIDSATGLFLAVAPGVTTVTATSGAVSGSALVTVMSADAPGINAVGPVDPANGYPQWYRDSNNLALQLCLDNNAFCILPTTEKFGDVVTFDPGKPIVFPSNYPSEAFYLIADSDVIRVGPNRAGKAILRVALEAAFGTLDPVGAPAPGQQMTFLRVNLKKISGLVPNSTYTVSYPYGTFTIQTDALGNTVRGLAGQAYRAEDGCVGTPCDFTMLLPAQTTHIGPFLSWTGLPAGGLVDPATGNHYVGDGVTPHTVTGSPLIDARTGQPQNFFRIDGPDIGGRGINTIQTDLWTLSGKIAPPAP